MESTSGPSTRRCSIGRSSSRRSGSISTELERDLDGILARSDGLWEGLRGARLFITGGTGFFGCWLLESLLHATQRLRLGASAVVLTRNAGQFRERRPHLANHPAVALHEGDVRSFEAPPGAFTHVLHAAAERSDQSGAIIEGTRRALDFASRRGAARFLFISSGAVYGNQPGEPSLVGEDADPGPLSGYGEAKRAAEQLCLVAPRGLQVAIARCFAFTGAYLPHDGPYAIGNFIRDALAGGPIRVAGDGRPTRSYLYGADLAVWLWTVFLRGEDRRPYNVGSEDGSTIRDLACTVRDVLAPSAEVRVALEAGPAPPPYVPSTRRARAELGVEQTVPLREAIERTAAWYRAYVPSISSGWKSGSISEIGLPKAILG